MTLGDLERWLKQDPNRERTINVQLTKKEVRVIMGGVTCISATLEGAIENAFEELRRKANGIDSNRTERAAMETGAVGFNPWVLGANTLLSGPNTPLHASVVKGLTGPYEVAACGTVTSIKGTCPQCKALPSAALHPRTMDVACKSGHKWTCFSRTIYIFLDLTRGEHDGLNWQVVP